MRKDLDSRPFTALCTLALCIALALPVLGFQVQPPKQARPNTNERAGVQPWAVLIGVSRYADGDRVIDGNKIPNLKNAADDAQALYDFLRADERGGFKDVKEGGRTILLKDEEATRANVERALESLKQSKPEDYFVIYIAAHGALVPQKNPKTGASEEVPYFTLHDSNLRDMVNTGLRMDAFRKLVGEIPARQGLVLSDTCHSAGVQLAGRGLYTTTRANTRLLDEMKNVGPGVGFISAADQTELSYELDDLNHGVFTHCLIEGLRGNADLNRDGTVRFVELKDYLRDTVPELTGQKQHPQYNTTSIEANYLPLSVVPYLAANTGSSTDYGTLVIRTPDLDDVQVTVDGEKIGSLGRAAERRVRVPAGLRNLRFARGDINRTLEAKVEAGKSKVVEINLSFSESEEDSLVDPTPQQVNVFLREDKEPSKEAKDFFLKGVENFNKQRYDAAIDSLNKAVQASGGGYVDALVFRGRAEQSAGRREAAVASFKAALAARPSDFEVETLLAEARFNAGDNVQEVVAQLRNIARRHPNFEFARVVLGDVLLWRGDPAAAELELRRAIKINPKSPPAHMILADILTYQESKDKRREAIEQAEKALQLFEEVSRKQVSAARGLKRLSISHVIFGGGRYTNVPAMAEAHHIIAKAITRMVEFEETLPDAARYLDKARAHLQEALKLARTIPDKHRLALVLVTSAQNYLAKGDLAASLKDGEEALKTCDSIPDLKGYWEAHHALYTAYVSDQKFAKAVDHYQQYLNAVRSDMSAEQVKDAEAELARLKRLRDANRQKN